MQKLSNMLLTLGFLAIAYAGFSSVYGQRGIALKTFPSTVFLALGNFFILISIVAAVKELSNKA
ncbi:MAG: hypothetical protein PHI86_01975 [Candidatus Omnitrophica bacterium]|nr:hypothetical protein [Candidatus Omnitrophota bacterium]HOX55214.1 hypothetical protein [Candidatus Omnitrophota bacterium]